ncbi:sulfotransferase [Desulfobacterium sp. N47]|uniref:Sulfotransferase family protein n=1 Tax=uncultured Desulfobacterium sp. TaxID=201089 RepID=E1YL23_9BACT|nr:hypothetical protein N47_E43180 [uncultured Desulfobacterium sp.]
MALQIIGAGFGRTGSTLSVYNALNQLGFPCYHTYEILENKENKSHMDFWLKAGILVTGRNSGDALNFLTSCWLVNYAL